MINPQTNHQGIVQSRQKEDHSADSKFYPAQYRNYQEAAQMQNAKQFCKG